MTTEEKIARLSTTTRLYLRLYLKKKRKLRVSLSDGLKHLT